MFQQGKQRELCKDRHNAHDVKPVLATERLSSELKIDPETLDVMNGLTIIFSHSTDRKILLKFN